MVFRQQGHYKPVTPVTLLLEARTFLVLVKSPLFLFLFLVCRSRHAVVIISGLLYCTCLTLLLTSWRKGLKQFCTISLVFSWLQCFNLRSSCSDYRPTTGEVSFITCNIWKRQCSHRRFLDNRVSSDIKPPARRDRKRNCALNITSWAVRFLGGLSVGRLIRWLRKLCCLDHYAFYCLFICFEMEKFKETTLFLLTN